MKQTELNSLENFMLYESLTEMVYTMAKIQATLMGSPVVPDDWNDRDIEFRNQMRLNLQRYLAMDEIPGPQELHDNWCEEYRVMGWTYGEQYSVEHKTHPDLVPYWELHPFERVKDEVFSHLLAIAALTLDVMGFHVV
jgi:hypothetical protein